MSTSKYKTRSFAAINRDDQIRQKSSSGGVFYEIAMAVIETGGVVFGAGFDSDGQVCHKKCESIEKLPELMQSKYVQSSVGDTYKDVLEELKHRKVLFSGTPCQVYGLLSYLKTSSVSCDNLLTVDLVCHGVPSRSIWRRHLAEISEGRSPTDISFRDKTNGWKDFSLRVNFSNGSQYLQSKDKDPFVRGFLKNLYLRESCYQCEFRGVDRESDFTIADFWKVEEYLPELYDNKGTSVVMAHNDRALCILESLPQLMLVEIDNEIIVQTNTPVVRSVQRNPKRELFYRTLLDENSLGEQISAAIRVPFTRRLVNTIKRMIK